MDATLRRESESGVTGKHRHKAGKQRRAIACLYSVSRGFIPTQVRRVSPRNGDEPGRGGTHKGRVETKMAEGPGSCS